MNNNHKIHVLRFEECYAKLVLEQMFPERFSRLEIIDKPDLQSSTLDVGIEVTTAVPSSGKEKDHLFSQLEQKRGTSEQQIRSKDRIRQLGGIYHEPGIMTSWINYRDLNRIYDALEKKLKKLNANEYKQFEKHFLFITDESLIRTEELSEIHSELNRRQKLYQHQFDSIFLYLFGGRLFEFNMRSGKNALYEISNVVTLAEKAIKIADRSSNL